MLYFRIRSTFEMMLYRLLLLLSILLYGQSLSAQEKATSEIQYDSTYAAKLGADDYGMKPYVMAFLKAGPNRSQDAETAAALQKAHLQNIMRMAEEGTLVLAGPFLDQGEVRGIYIFNVATVAEAEALTNTDPAIQAGRLVMELHPWYGSAALMEVNQLHKKVQKKSVAD